MKKKITAIILLLSVITCSMTLMSSAFSKPELEFAADYDQNAKTLTVYYVVEKFEGVQAADFRLNFDTNVLKFKSTKGSKLGSNEYIETGLINGSNDTVSITFIDLYYAKKDILESDGSVTLATITFDVLKDESTNLISYSDDCAMEPDSAEANVDTVQFTVDLSKNEKTYQSREKVIALGNTYSGTASAAKSVETPTIQTTPATKTSSANSKNSTASAGNNENDISEGQQNLIAEKDEKTSDGATKSAVKKVIIAAVIVLAVLVIAIISIVRKANRQSDEDSSEKSDEIKPADENEKSETPDGKNEDNKEEDDK